MTAVLIVVAALALVGGLAAVAWGRSLRVRLAVTSAERESLQAEIVSLQKTGQEAESRLLDAERRSSDADDRADSASRLAESAHRRAAEAESRATQADALAASAERRANEAEERLAVVFSTVGDDGLAALTKLRLEREWAEVAGAAVPMPAAWDGSVSAALAAELEIIREVIGTPSSLESAAGMEGRDVEPLGRPNWRLGAVSCEFLRGVARVADELVVVPSESTASLLVKVATAAGGLPDLSAFREAAEAVGVTVVIEPTEGGFLVQLDAGPPPGNQT